MDAMYQTVLGTQSVTAVRFRALKHVGRTLLELLPLFRVVEALTDDRERLLVYRIHFIRADRYGSDCPLSFY